MAPFAYPVCLAKSHTHTATHMHIVVTLTITLYGDISSASLHLLLSPPSYFSFFFLPSLPSLLLLSTWALTSTHKQIICWSNFACARSRFAGNSCWGANSASPMTQSKNIRVHIHTFERVRLVEACAGAFPPLTAVWELCHSKIENKLRLRAS